MVQFPRWQILLVMVVLLAGLVFASPNLFSKASTEGLPGWVPSDQISLGLDLRGGSHLLVEADIESVFEEQQESLVAEIRQELRENRIGYTGLGLDGQDAVVTIRDSDRVGDARRVIQQLVPDMLVNTESGGLVRASLTEQARRDRITAIMQQTVEIIRRRIDATGTREASIQRQGERRVVVQVPGIQDPERIKELMGKTAKLTFRFVNENVRPDVDRVPPGFEVLPSQDSQGPREYVVSKRVMVSGANLVDSQPTFEQGQPVVSFRFDPVGAERFGRATSENVGRLFAIVLDDEVISAPVIRGPILGGTGIITGTFSVQEVNDLSLLLRAGALPAPLTFLEERTVGPGLGADSVAAGQIASILGLIFVVIFMGASYGLFGMLANVALMANLILIMAALSGLQATLTLPGIAGIVLTIGMAVDANVLIFERIREEARAGRGAVTAIDAGYRRAITTIVDSNLTTFIAAILLFLFGTGPVKGFAVTLAIGLVTSMFSAIMLTRLLVVLWLRRRRQQQALPI